MMKNRLLIAPTVVTGVSTTLVPVVSKLRTSVQVKTRKLTMQFPYRIAVLIEGREPILAEKTSKTYRNTKWERVDSF